jgi:hypothetical protein
VTGQGVKEFFDAVEASREEYEKYVHDLPHLVPRFLMICRDYLPELERARKAKEESLKAVKEDSMNRLLNDLSIDRAKNPDFAAQDRWDPEAEEDDEDEDGDFNIIDRSEYPVVRGVGICSADSDNFAGSEPWPGQYVDLTKAKRHPDEEINWPRPG